MNVKQLQGADSFTLAPGHELRRATATEVSVIKGVVGNLGRAPQLLFQNLWEHPWPHRSGKIEFLPQAEWRYFVVAFKGTNRTVSEFESAFDLATLELEVGFTILGGTRGHGMMWTPGRLFHVLENARFNSSFFVDVCGSDIDSVKEIYAQLQQHDHRLVDLKRLVAQLSELKGLPHDSPLRFLGYFAILESLLTHAPKPSDPYDSITRQVRKKLALLDHRWPQAIDYTPFGGAASDTIWTKMYAYRSVLAHGGAPDFAGELAALVDHKSALSLVKETVKSVIRQALKEPQLVLDLRDC